MSIADASILPDHVYVNASFILSLPRGQRIATGLDALAQGIESYWATAATPQSREYAKKAIANAWTHLLDFVEHPDAVSARAMSEASHYAGRAINLTKTTACHALSYTMTYTHGIPHGVAVAVTLGPMLVFNAGVREGDVQDQRGVAHVQSALHAIAAMLGFSTADEACKGIQHLLDELIGGHTLAHLGIREQQHIQAIADGVNMERLGNNPRKVTREAVLTLLRSLA